LKTKNNYNCVTSGIIMAVKFSIVVSWVMTQRSL